MASKALSEIPTLARLYELGTLKPSADALFPPSPSLNERVAVYRGDITTLSVDAIVNAANTSLLGGGGVDGAIHCAAGPSLVSECRTLNGCPTGGAKMTKGYELPARHVIHTVGPIYFRTGPSRSEQLLTSCYNESLKVAGEAGLKSVAFSGIGTGAYGYPSRDAADVACCTVREFLERDGGGLERVVFVTFLQKDVDAYNEMLP